MDFDFDGQALTPSYREERLARARTAFRMAGWIGLLGAGWGGLGLVLVGAPGILPMLMVAAGAFYLFKGLRLRASAGDEGLL